MSYKFQRSLELATDQTLVEPNWEGILECVDMIRGGEVPVKEALKTIQKRYHNPNPHIAHHALLILEACVKNCGKKFINEVASKEFMDDLKSMVISNQSEKIRDKLLELIQCWTSAFKGIPEYKIVEDTHSLLKMNGFEFPPIDEAKAMFLADSAPDWAEGDNCYRCRAEFGVFKRKHHCRACGQIFCDNCSNKQMLLPQFGIEKKVRVCEACFDKRQGQASVKTKSRNESEDLAKSEADTREKARKEAEEKEQEELQLALAISQSEAEAKERDKWSNLYSSYNGSNADATNEPISRQQTEFAISKNSAREEVSLSGMGDDTQEQPFDSMLAKYLDRDYWEKKRRETEDEAARATAPPPSEISISMSSSVSQQPARVNGIDKNENAASNVLFQPEPLNENNAVLQQNKHPQYQNDELLTPRFATMDLSELVTPRLTDDTECEDVADTSGFCLILKERVDTLSTRMRSNQLRGRSIVNDSAIHSLFSQLTDAHAKVLERMTKLEGKREHYEKLQDHLGYIGEARQAINALREESERQRQELLREEQTRRQAQLRQKLDFMRHKKHEMLLNERQVAIQRFQHNERQILHQRMVQQQQQPQAQHYSPVPAYQQHQQQHYLGNTIPSLPTIEQQQHPAASMQAYQPHPQQHHYVVNPMPSIPTIEQQQQPQQHYSPMPAYQQHQQHNYPANNIPPIPIIEQQQRTDDAQPQPKQSGAVPEDLLISFD